MVSEAVLTTIVVAVVVTKTLAVLPRIVAAAVLPALITQNGVFVMVAPKVSVIVVCAVTEVVKQPAVSVEPVHRVALPAPDSAKLVLLRAAPL